MNTNTQPLYAVLNPDDIALLERNQNQSTYSTNNFISIYDIENLKEQKVSLPSEIREGDVLVFTGENTYSKIKDGDSVQSILQKRVAAIDHICYLLGCTNYLAEETLDIQYKDDQTGKIKGQTKINVPIDDSVIPVEGGGSIDGEFHQNGKLSGKTSLKTVAKENVLTEESYKKAISIAREYNLLNDYWINYLIEQRDPKNPGAILQKEFHSELSLNVASSVKIAIELNSSIGDIISSKLNIDASLNKFRSFSSVFSFIAEFPDANTNESDAKYTVLPDNSNNNPSMIISTSQTNIQSSNVTRNNNDLNPHTMKGDDERESGDVFSIKYIELENKYNQLEHNLQILKDGFEDKSESIETIQGKIPAIIEQVQTFNTELKIFTLEAEKKCREIIDSQINILKGKHHELEVCLIGVTKDTESNFEKIKSIENTLSNILINVQKLTDKFDLIQTDIEKKCLEFISKETKDVEKKQYDLESKLTETNKALENNSEIVLSLKDELSIVYNDIKILKDKISTSNIEVSGKIEHIVSQQNILSQELSATKYALNEIAKHIEDVTTELNDKFNDFSKGMFEMSSKIEQLQQQRQTFDEQMFQEMKQQNQKIKFMIVAIISVFATIVICAVAYAQDNYLIHWF